MRSHFPKRLQKKAKRGFKGYPIGTVAFYGPDNRFASKIAAAVHVSDDPLAPVESHQPKSPPFAVLTDLLSVEPSEPTFPQSVGDPPDNGGLADPEYARQQQDAPGNHSALLRRLGVEGRESPRHFLPAALRALRFRRFVLGNAFALLEDLATGFAPILTRRQGPS
jgi:hypothetical protein